MRRAVFDSTVLVSALLRPTGLADELLTIAGLGGFEIILSSAIIIETWRVLTSAEHIRDRYPMSDERIHSFCLGLSELATEVLRATRPPAPVVRDESDDMVVACALDGKADTIVSRDNDLLALGNYQNISIITPETFRQQLRNASPVS